MKSFAARLFVMVLGVSVAGCGGGTTTPAPSAGPGPGASAPSARQHSPTQGQKDESKTEPSTARVVNPPDAPKDDKKPDEKKADPKGEKKDEKKGKDPVEAKDQLKGSVKYNGKPLDGGQIAFRSAAGETIGADINKDGTYVIVNPPKGTMKVAISYIDPKATEYFRALSAAGKDKDKPPPSGDPSQFYKIPAKYGDVGASGLSVEYKGGIGTFDFELKDDAPKTGEAPKDTPKK